MNGGGDVESRMGVLAFGWLKDTTSAIAVDAQGFSPRASDQRDV